VFIVADVKLSDVQHVYYAVSQTGLGVLRLLDGRTEAVRTELLYRIRLEAGQPDRR